jgi:hypothetical protein
MLPLHEDVIRRAIPLESLSPGEDVRVVTRMGGEVSRGRVIRVFQSGCVQIREFDLEHGGTQSIADRIYDADLYLFIEMDPEDAPGEDPEFGEPEEKPVLILNDPENAVDSVLGSRFDESEAPEAAPKKADKAISKSDARAPASRVDVEKLPADIQKRLKGVGDLDEDAVDRVMSAISESALKALRGIGVRDSEIYERVVEIQKAVRPVIESK